VLAPLHYIRRHGGTGTKGGWSDRRTVNVLRVGRAAAAISETSFAER